jgi:hypothetical protein
VSRLLSSRDAILTALRAGGLTVATSGKFNAPCVLVEAGDPWATVELSLGRRRVGRWRLTLVAGRADTDGILEKLAELVDTTDRALLKVPGAQLPTWAQPFHASLAQITYAATSSTIQAMTEEDPVP